MRARTRRRSSLLVGNPCFLIRISVSLLALLFPLNAFADAFVVSNNPYRNVAWGSTLRCMAQLHDHIKSVDRIAPYDDAGYCAITWMDYSGYYLATDGTRNGWGDGDEGIKPWPATDYGATDPSLLTSVEFYIPGSEELGTTSTQFQSDHIHSTFLTEYIEGAGCDSCGSGGTPLPPLPIGIASSQLYDSTEEMIDLINSKGGFAIVNHPSIGNANAETNWMGIEIVNTFMALRDEVALSGVTDRLDQALGDWDAALENRSARIWGVATNDNYGPYRDVCGGGGEPACTSSQVPDPLTADHLDQGKIEVLLTSKDLDTFETAFRQGAFFAVREDETASTKGAYPEVTGVTVTTSLISITTTAGDETITWIGNGSSVGTGATLSLRGLPTGTKYVRAEIDDGSGRTLYTQPFELSAPSPSAVGAFGRLASSATTQAVMSACTLPATLPCELF